MNEATSTTPARLIAEIDREHIRGKLPSTAAFDETGRLPINNLLRFSKTVVINITNECPVKCAHCFAHSGGKLRGDAEFETIATAVVAAARSPHVDSVIFCGGEPFVAPDRLEFGLQLARREKLPAGVVTSCNWGESVDRARDIYRPFAQNIETLYVSMDVYHQRRVPVQHVRNALIAALEYDNDVAIVNSINADQIAQGLLHDPCALQMAEEFKLPIHTWPLFGIGRAEKLKSHVPTLDADQPCGIINRPTVNPGGAIHACSYGTLVFHERHPLYSGHLKQDRLEDVIDRNSRSLFIQAIRLIGPLKLLRLIADADYRFQSQCEACYALTAQPNVVERVEAALRERPEFIEHVTRTRRMSQDLRPEDHLTEPAV